MANLRIKDLPTTAATTASDDFFGVDGATNGTRKLSAYSPTFGGNATVGGTLTVSGAVSATSANASTGSFQFTNTAANQTPLLGSLLAANTATGSSAQGPYFPIGVALSTNNSAVIQFNYLSSGSATNTIGLGLYGGSKWFLDGNGNTSQTGNLTVSGTGTSYFAGDITSTATGNNQWQITKGAATNYATLVFSESTSGSVWAIGQRTTASAGGANRLSFYGSGVGGDAMQLTYLGNLLLGTTTDGGQKLQVAGTVNISNAGSSTIANFTNSANSDFQIVLTASTSAKIGPSTPTSLILQTNSTTALTLDSSQNATFAGTVTSSNGSLNGFRYYASGASTDQKYWAWQNGSAVGDGTLRLRALNDAQDNGKNAIVIKRTGISTVIVNLPSLPTSSSGLSAGDLWNDSGTVKIV